jgi:hypothetical protein
MRWLLLILGLGLVLRLYGLARYSLWYDEASIFGSQGYLGQPWRYFDSTYGNEPPLQFWSMSAWYRFVFDVLGAEVGSVGADYLIRLMPAVFSTVAIALTFVFARAVTSATRPALFAAFLFAISPFQIYYAQEFRVYAPYIVLSILAAWAMHRALESGKWGPWLGFVLASAVGIHNHYFMVWNVVAFNLYVVLCGTVYWRRVGGWIISNMLIIYLSIPALKKAFYSNAVFELGTVAWFPTPDFRIGLITIKNFFAGYSPNAGNYTILLGLGLLLMAGGCFALRKQPKALIFLVTLAFAPLVINILYWQTKDSPYYTHRLMIFSAVPMYILVGHGIAALRSAKVMAVCLAALVGLTFIPLSDHYNQRLHPSWDHLVGARYKTDTRGAAGFVKERMREGDTFIHRANFTVPSFRHYLVRPQIAAEFTDRDVWYSLRGWPDIDAYETSGTGTHQLDQSLPDAGRVWFIQSSWEPFSIDLVGEAMARWFDLHGVRVLRQPFDGLTVYLYDFDVADVPRTDQLADTGSVQALRYDRGTPPELGEDALDRSQYLLHDVSRPVEGWGARFETTLVRAEGEPIDEVLGSAALLDQDGDGVIDSVGFERTDRLLAVGDSIDINGARNSLIALDSAGKRALFAGYSRRVTDGFGYRFVVENARPDPLDLRVRIMESAEVLEAMSFSLSNSGSSVWHPEFQYDRNAAPLAYNRFAFVATLGRDSHSGASIYRDFTLDPGTYRVYVRCLVQGGGSNRHGARASVFLGDVEASEGRGLVGVVTPVDDDAETGWRWLSAGSFSATGGIQRLTVAVDNGDRLETARFHLESVVLVHLELGDQSGVIRIREESLRLSANSSLVVEERGEMGTAVRKRVDIELSDAAGLTFRDLHFYVNRASTRIVQ